MDSRQALGARQNTGSHVVTYHQADRVDPRGSATMIATCDCLAWTGAATPASADEAGTADATPPVPQSHTAAARDIILRLCGRSAGARAARRSPEDSKSKQH